LNSGLNLLLVLFIARAVPTEIFADLSVGIIYGGPFSILLAFGNDTILAKRAVFLPGFSRVVATLRVVVFAPVLAVVAMCLSVPAAAGFAIVAGASIQQRFHFEATTNQFRINAIGMGEKALSLAGMYWWMHLSDASRPEGMMWWIIIVKCGTGILVSWPIMYQNANVGWGGIRDVYQLCVGAVPFLLGNIATQSPALISASSASQEVLADFGMASQIGSGLLACLTLWQRPAVLKYIRNEISIRRELMLSMSLCLAAIGIVCVGVVLYGVQFKLLPAWSVVYGFMILSIVTSVLHPMEVRGYATGKISGRGLISAAATVVLIALPVSSAIGLWAVPLAMAQYQVAVFLYHRLWKSHSKGLRVVES
jgi:hypothetical protein